MNEQSGAHSTALKGLRVLEFGNLVAGPLAGLILADMGADVIKVERPVVGDEGRSIGPKIADQGFFFVTCNRNKRSIVLDLNSPEGRDLALSLSLEADVILDNSRPGVMEKFGLNYQALAQKKPEIVCCSIAGFMGSGSYAGRPAYDPVIQAISGLMMATGWEDSPPVRIAQSVLDVMTGVLAATGILGALYSRQQTGLGAEVGVSLIGSSAFLMAPDIVRYLGTGVAPVRTGTAGAAVPSDAYETADGRWVFIATGNERNYASLCRALDSPELIDDERFSSMAARQENRQIFTKVLGDICRKYSVGQLYDALTQAGVPCAPVNQMSDSLADADLFRGLIFEMDARSGLAPQVRVPIELHGGPGHAQDSPPPSLGEHTDEILQGLLGLSSEEIVALRDRNVIG